MKTETSSYSEKGSLVLLVLIRLAWLVGPELFAIRNFHDTPLACILMCAGILAVWLSVDVGPFKAGEDSAPVPQTMPAARRVSMGRSVMQAGAKLMVLAIVLQTRLAGF